MTSLLDVPRGVAPADLSGERAPRIRVRPPYVATTGPEVRELSARAGLFLDPWQADALDDALGERENGDWAAFEVGVVVARQNGKGGITEARELGGLFLLREPLMLHTAHEVKTAGEAFLRILALIQDSDEFSSRVKRINRSHGEEGIELLPSPTIVHGSGARGMSRGRAPRLRFLARSRVGGRGFTGRVVFLDEAFELSDASIAALLPTMSAQPNPQLWYTSTPPNQAKDNNARVLARLRQRARSGTGRRLVYLEWSAADREDLDPAARTALRIDPRAWARANPALGIRISPEFIEAELGAMDPVDFEVERLGIGDWPAPDAQDAWQVVPKAAWDELVDADSQPRDPVAFAADVTPEADFGAIAVAGHRTDGRLHVEVTDHRSGSAWIVDRLVELARKWRPCAVVVDPTGRAGSLITSLERAGVEVVQPTSRQAAQAHGQFVEAAVDSRQLRHLGQPELAAALAGAAQRDLGDAKAWARRGTSVDISPLVAVTLAVWGQVTHAGSSAFFASWR